MNALKWIQEIDCDMSQRFYFYTPRNHFNSIQRPWKLRPRNTKSFPAFPYAFPFKTAWKQHFLTTTQVYSGLSFQGPFSRGVSSWVGWSKFPRHHKKKNWKFSALSLSATTPGRLVKLCFFVFPQWTFTRAVEHRSGCVSETSCSEMSASR